MGVLLISHHLLAQPSDWVQRWSHLVPTGASVLDVGCGSGRHMKWFAELGMHVTGIDRDPAALMSAKTFGSTCLADMEAQPWPLMTHQLPSMFDLVVVTNYLWRPLFSTLLQSVSPNGLLLYETFAQGNATVGKPSNPAFLLTPGELLQRCQGFRVIAYEDGTMTNPDRFVQRIAARKPHFGQDLLATSPFESLSLK